MSDDRLLELKRAWERSRSTADEVAYLQERLRLGELSEHQLELAAYCGHLAARELVGDQDANDDLKFTISWLKPVFTHSIAISTKAALVIGEVLLRTNTWMRESNAAAGLVAALEDWLRDRNDVNAVQRMREELTGLFQVADEADLPEVRAAVQHLAMTSAIAEGHAWNQLPMTLQEIPSPKILRAIREAIRDELAPWLLEQAARA